MRVQTMNKKFREYYNDLRKMEKEFELKLDDFLYRMTGVTAEITVGADMVWIETIEVVDIPEVEERFLLCFEYMTIKYDRNGDAVEYEYVFTHKKIV